MAIQVISYPDRTFRLWSTTVNFQRLLLRSPKSEIEGLVSNVDIYFWGVAYVDIPSIIRGLVIEDSTENDLELVTTKYDCRLREVKIYVCVSGNHRYYIVAAGNMTDVNEDEIHDFRWSPTHIPK
jgi:hypothetical protein